MSGPRPLPSVSGRPLVIAHRGASGYRPENTLAAYELAVLQGADMIEIDLHLSRDRGIPIAHDSDLEHLGRQGEIGDLSLAEIAELDAGQGERVPELAPLLDAFGERIPFNLEIKIGEKLPYEGLEGRALAEVRARNLMAPTLWSSFYDAVLNELRRLEPGARVGVLVSPRAPERIFERAAAVDAEAINPFFSLVNSDLIGEAHARGLAVYPFTVDAEDEMKRLIDLGVDGLFTNFPDRMRALVPVSARS